MYTTRSNDQSIAEIELLSESTAKDKLLYMPFPQEVENTLMKNTNIPSRPQLFINPVSVNGVINTVRNIILKWTLKLEKDGILGESMTFSKEEKQTATQTTFNIENMTGSQIQQGTQSSTQNMTNIEVNIESVKNFISEVEKNIDKLEVDDIPKSDLKADIDTIKSQISTSRPNEIIIKESLFSIRSILEKVAVGAISTGLLKLLGTLLLG